MAAYNWCHTENGHKWRDFSTEFEETKLVAIIFRLWNMDFSSLKSHDAASWPKHSLQWHAMRSPTHLVGVFAIKISANRADVRSNHESIKISKEKQPRQVRKYTRVTNTTCDFALVSVKVAGSTNVTKTMVKHGKMLYCKTDHLFVQTANEKTAVFEFAWQISSLVFLID